MPGSIIVINRSKDLTWYVGDSQMDELIKYLDKHGYRETKTAEETIINIRFDKPLQSDQTGIE